ncbi:hypothetical protein ACFE04_009162 [Oxalis oulophora]
MKSTTEKIYPVASDMESVPVTSATSEKLGEHLTAQERAIPLTQTRQTERRSCSFCKCICWTLSLLFLLLIMLAATVGILYHIFQPKVPNYSVDNFSITDLRLNFDMTLYAAFGVNITANNPNNKIGIYYKKGGKLSVWYNNTKLCNGPLPTFYQGHQNTTKLNVFLTGKTNSGTGSTLMSALMVQQQTGEIPLDLKVRAPVAIKLGNLKLREVWISGHCSLVVDSLNTNQKISIKASNCSFRLKL